MASISEPFATSQLSTLPSDLPSGSPLTHRFSSFQSTALVSSLFLFVFEKDAFRVIFPIILVRFEEEKDVLKKRHIQYMYVSRPPSPSQKAQPLLCSAMGDTVLCFF